MRPALARLLLALLASGAVPAGAGEPLSVEQKLADLHHLASTIQSRHPSPYEWKSKEEWRARLEELSQGLEPLDAAGFFFRLQAVAALADDIHTSVFPLAEQGLLTETYPIRLRRLAEGLVIRAAKPDHGDLVGARIESFGGVPVEAVMARVSALVPGNARLACSNVPLAYLLCPETYGLLGIEVGAEGLPIEILDREGKQRRVHLAPEPVSLMAAYEAGTVVGWRTPPGWVSLFDAFAVGAPKTLALRGEMAWFEPLADGKVLLVQVNSPAPDPENRVLGFAAELYRHLIDHAYQRVIVDLRGNEGGWYVLTNALAGILASIPSLGEPGRVVVLIGPETTSAGVALATQLELATEAFFVGGPTGSSPNVYGTYRPEQLPHSKIYFRVSSRRLVLSPPEDDRRALFPDLPVPERLEDLRRGRDAALEAALALDPASLPPLAPWYERWRRESQLASAAAATSSRKPDRRPPPGAPR
ncbi:MAG TPA: hypothetical protein VF017_09220 [Thermoanaerobaculia bacterium]|nr:hypothetical protein [Thermoanaerobaculia bacterium]